MSSMCRVFKESMNVTQLAVLELIKKKKASKEASVAKSSAKSRRTLSAEMPQQKEESKRETKTENVKSSDAEEKREVLIAI